MDYKEQENTNIIGGIEIKKNVSERVKSIRNKIGITQKKFADNIDISPETIKKIEQGVSPLSLDIALRISKHYDVSLDYLYELSDFMNENEIIISKAFESIFNVSLIHITDYIDTEGKMYNTDILKLTSNKYLIEFLLESKKIEEMKNNGKLDDEEYNLNMEFAKDKYYKAIRVCKKENMQRNDYLISTEFVEKLLSYDITKKDLIN